jgi:hypothetical protein
MVCNHVASIDQSKAIIDNRQQTEATTSGNRSLKRVEIKCPSAHKTVVVTWGGDLRDNNLGPVSSPTPLNTPPPYYTTELLH